MLPIGCSLLLCAAYPLCRRAGSRFYRAYGAKRSGNDFSFERNYTGQHLDDTGLLYYGARYYDPAAGRFISPDTLVPDPGNVLDYNRYLYGRGNPLKYNDPSGHCATTGNGSSDANDGDCWAMANTITQQWDAWDVDGYWSSRFTSKAVFAEYIVPSPGIGAEFLQDEIMRFLESPSGQALPEPVLRVPPPPLDLGDYTSFSSGFNIGEWAIIIDDYGNGYVRLGVGGSFGKYPSLTRGDILVNSSGELVDIDQLALSSTEASAAARRVLTGDSASLSGAYWLGVGGSMSYSLPHNVTIEANATVRGAVSVIPWSRTWVLWEGR